MKQNSVLTVRLNADHTILLNEILKKTGIATASELVRFFLKEYDSFVKDRDNLNRLSKAYNDLEREHKDLKNAIKTIISVQ